MRDIRSIFSEQEQRVYEKLPLAAAFYLHENNDNKVILVSDKFCEIYHVDRKNVLGKFDHNKYVQVHKDDQEKIELTTQKFDKGEIEKYAVTCRVFNKNENRYVWHHASGAFLDLDSDARVAMINFENIDKQIEQAKIQTNLKIKNEAEYKEVQNILTVIIQEQTEYVLKFDEENEKVHMVAAKGNFVGFKEGYSEITFKEYEDALKTKINIVGTYGGKRFNSCKECLAAVKDKANLTNYIIKKDGETYYKFSLIFRGRQDNNLYSLVYDITNVAKKEYDRAEELKKANDAKSEFLSRMSHDMRTPLGAVIATANFGIDEINNEQAREYFKTIRNSSNYLLAIMNDILDTQKLSHDHIKLVFDVFEIAKLNKEVKDIVLKTASENNIKMVFIDNYCDKIKYIRTDKQRLEQVLINLLNNAIKYTPKDGSVNATCSFEQDNEASCLKYTIQDNGIGMSEEFQKKMFEPFTREKNEFTVIEDGTGVGLSIVKNIIEIVGGSINCKSKLGEGTTFIVKLPLNEVSQEDIKILEETKKHKALVLKKEALKGKHVLLVEDIEINRIIARKILINMGVTVTSVVNGKEALESVKKNSYNLILMDSRMPIMDGLTATTEIRKFNQTIPIVGLSANAFLEDINKSIAVGMNEYLAKPIDRKKLAEILLKYC